MTNDNHEQQNRVRPAWIRTLAHAARWALALGIVASLAPLCAEEPLQVEEADALAAAVTKHEPAYPPVARQLRVQGKVTVQATIDEEGKVAGCEPVSGNAILTAAAVNAVKTWKFKPFTSGGKPARAVAKLTFNFQM